LGAERANSFVGGRLPTGRQSFHFPATLPANAFALDGAWTIGQQPITAGNGAGIQLAFNADHVYLDVGGTGTLTATFQGRTRSFRVSGAPDIYPVIDATRGEQGQV